MPHEHGGASGTGFVLAPGAGAMVEKGRPGGALDRGPAMIPTYRHPLLDLPLPGAGRLAALEDRAAALLATDASTLFFGAEAVLALEAVTAGLGGKGVEWLNVVTSPYGRLFGEMLRSRGSVVHDLTPPNDRPVRTAEVSAALERLPEVSALSVVHAESLTGILNPLPAILALAAERELLTVVDAVASAGAEPLAVDALGIDVCVLGPQKGWGGPAGASIVTVSERAWAAMLVNPSAARGSVLSLLDVKDQWIDRDRRRVRGTPPPLEVCALEAALDRLEAEGINAVVDRHHRAAAAARAGLQAMGLSLWIADERDACAVATPVRLPTGVDADAVVAGAAREWGIGLTPGSGDLAGVAVRVDHMGANASPAYVALAIAALGSVIGGLGAVLDVGAAAAAVVPGAPQPAPA